MPLVDSRLVNVDWAVTEAVTAVMPVSFLDAAGDILPVDTWTFAAKLLSRPGADPLATLTVDVTQAAVGQIAVTADDSVTDSIGQGQYTWTLVWTVAGEPTGGLGGRFTISPAGAPGSTGVVVTA